MKENETKKEDLQGKYNAVADSEVRSHWVTLRSLGAYLWPDGRIDLKSRLVLALSCLAAAKVLNVYVPFLLKDAIDSLSSEKTAISLPLGIIIAYGMARVIAQAFAELRDFVFVRVAQNAQRKIALQTFQHLHALSLDFHLSRQTGGLSRSIERGTRGISFVLTFMTFNIVPTLVEILLVTVVISYHFNLVYAGVIFLTVFAYIISTLVVTEWRLKFRRKMNSEESEANNKAIDSLLNFETVKYFGNENHEYQRFDRNLEQYESAAVANQTSLSVLNLLQGTIIGVGLIIVLSMSAHGVVRGELTIGDFVLVNAFLMQLYLPLNFLGFVYRQVKQSLIDMDKMFELVQVVTNVKDAPDAKDLDISSATVEFEDVEFSYHDDREILKGISFKVNQGETVAIVGPSGGGKSTISRLLFRFYDVDSGSIRINGSDIRDVTQSSLRHAIGVVPQDTVLFNETIGYNIRYGNPSASDEEMKQAASLANIDKFVEGLVQGYDTEVGERGLKLSGGEKQRVAIARTLLKKPQIFLFDEATSALDSHTEKEIQSSLQVVSQNHTTLVIAHRLSTIVSANLILVLNGGKIVEQGHHAELLAAQGEYASMWARQQEAHEHNEAG